MKLAGIWNRMKISEFNSKYREEKWGERREGREEKVEGRRRRL